MLGVLGLVRFIGGATRSALNASWRWVPIWLALGVACLAVARLTPTSRRPQRHAQKRRTLTPLPSQGDSARQRHCPAIDLTPHDGFAQRSYSAWSGGSVREVWAIQSARLDDEEESLGRGAALAAAGAQCPGVGVGRASSVRSRRAGLRP